MECLDLAIDLLDAKLEPLTEPYAAAVRLLCTIPGMDKDSAITIISEIGTDMSQFDSSKRLYSRASLTPGNN
ncbi:transposase [Selenomonas sp. GACV-9]|uniref:transposase n=1 Tax=Selenomonas sp. GACV-9 TaxID=3158782 RepID=UPI00387DC60E